jgi:hypothetical protein
MIDWERIKYAAVWGTGAFLLQVVFAIGLGGETAIPVTWKGWVVFLCNACIVAVGKRTSSTRMFGTNPRPTEEQRRAYLGLPPKRLS